MPGSSKNRSLRNYSKVLPPDLITEILNYQRSMQPRAESIPDIKEILRSVGIKSVESVKSPSRLFDGLIAAAATNSKPESKRLLLEILCIFCSADPQNYPLVAKRLPNIIELVPVEMKWIFNELLLGLAQVKNISAHLPAIKSVPGLGGIVDRDLCKACGTTLPAVEAVGQKRATLSPAP